ncbi:MAG TPA: adenylate/guanylate cyclase domain-containing protein [Candidatus Binataceae bacterium]
MAIGVVMVLAMFIINLVYPGALATFELKADDLRIALLAPPPPTDQVVIARIDDKSIQQLGQWPWPRATMGQLVNALAAYQAKVIGFDVLLTERDERDISRERIAKRLRVEGLKEASIHDILGTSNDDALADAIKSDGSTILSYSFASHQLRGSQGTTPVAGFTSEMLSPPPLAYNLVRELPGQSLFLIEADEYLPPIPVLNSAAHSTGFVDVDADLDGEIRRELTVIKFKRRDCVPFFLAVLAAYSDAQLGLVVDEEGVERVTLGATPIPVDEMGRMLIRFRGGADALPSYSISDIVARRVPGDKLKGRIVLVGVTGKGLGDMAVTPGGAEFPRVGIHANAIDNVLRGDFLHSSISTLALEREAGLVLGLAVALGAAAFTAVASLAFTVVLGAGYFVFAQHLLSADGLVIGVVFPELTVWIPFMVLVSYRYLTEGLAKRKLRVAFEHYLHPDVIEQIVTNPGSLKLGGERRNLSVLFADIVNYTGLSERTDPAALVAMLNDYMTKMTDHILESGGVVDKIRGDGIMAFWGAPAEVPNHAQAAIDSALAMLRELKALKENDPRFTDLDIGIGIATGEAIVGNFGGERRFDYSVIGDTVNLAARLEGLTRQFKVRLLVSRETFTKAGTQHLAREIGLVKVKGKTIAVPIVEVVGQANDGIDPTYYQQYGAILDKIRAGQAAAARSDLEHLLAERPDDEVVRIYLEKLAADSVGSSGELVFEFDTK